MARGKIAHVLGESVYNGRVEPFTEVSSFVWLDQIELYRTEREQMLSKRYGTEVSVALAYKVIPTLDYIKYKKNLK